ncbi:hypothetical protein [Microlunatus flavus]|uniref:Uncharacterized protein n=1 Tax=Microlunatus flavus TaxID=1036181 RepID=A0A1H9I5V4_9ACTN|nr:hypothetical protein [Microlunatus flavus]SEQ69950.1 hypothetical protein SAMN05421756_10597 [Microlunatus flavus]
MGVREWWARLTGDAPPPAEAESVELDRAPTEAELLAALDATDASVADGRVPALVASRVRRITRTVRDTLPRVRNLGLGSAEAYAVTATATTYLPEALAAYTRLPRQWADSRPVDGGKTSLMLLIDALDLLASSMEQIFDAAVRVDANALVVQGRFLQEKFGHSSVDPSTGSGLRLP